MKSWVDSRRTVPRDKQLSGSDRFWRGWILGDGTGCGKGREVVAILRRYAHLVDDLLRRASERIASSLKQVVDEWGLAGAGKVEPRQRAVLRLGLRRSCPLSAGLGVGAPSRAVIWFVHLGVDLRDWRLGAPCAEC